MAKKKVQAWLPPLYRVHTYIILGFFREKRPKASTDFAEQPFSCTMGIDDIYFMIDGK